MVGLEIEGLITSNKINYVRSLIIDISKFKDMIGDMGAIVATSFDNLEQQIPKDFRKVSHWV